MVTQQEIDNFYKHIDGLGLKFPVSALSKATGYSKGNVSAYLKNKDASENFMKAVYKAFPVSTKKVPHETYSLEGVESEKDKIIRLQEQNIQDLRDQIELLKSMLKK